MIKKIVWAALPMAVVFLVDNLINNPLGFYVRWWWFDIPMHMLGGFVTAWSALRFLKLEKQLVIKPRWIYFLLVLGIVALIGIAWEVYEFYLDKVVAFAVQPSVADTVADLANDVIGAAVFCVFLGAHYYQTIQAGQVRKN